MADPLSCVIVPSASGLDAFLASRDGSMTETSSLPAAWRDKIQRRVHSRVQSCNSGTALHKAHHQSSQPDSHCMSRCCPAPSDIQAPATSNTPSPSERPAAPLEAVHCPNICEHHRFVCKEQCSPTATGLSGDGVSLSDDDEGNGSGSGFVAAPCVSGQDVESCREQSPQSGATTCKDGVELPATRKRQHESADEEHEGSNEACHMDVGASCDNDGHQPASVADNGKDGSQCLQTDLHHLPDVSDVHQLLLPGAKRARVVWTADLHQRFKSAVDMLGAGHCMPKNILQLMHVDGMTRGNVASHLQKYRQTHPTTACMESAPLPSIADHQALQPLMQVSSPASSLSTVPFPDPVLLASLQQQQQAVAKPSVPLQPISFRQQRQQVLALQQAAMAAVSAPTQQLQQQQQQQLLNILSSQQQTSGNMLSGYPAAAFTQGMLPPAHDAASRSIDALSRQMSMFSAAVQQHLTVYGASSSLDQLHNSMPQVAALAALQQQQQQFDLQQQQQLQQHFGQQQHQFGLAAAFGLPAGWMGGVPSNFPVPQAGHWF